MKTQDFSVYKNPIYTYQSKRSDFRINLTEAWLCDDGGAYFIRHHSFELYVSKRDWLGLSERRLGNHFTNVFGTMFHFICPMELRFRGLGRCSSWRN
ncbi:hypothetical protein [Bacillus sp. AR18-7]|uniref:hypothetical protein n=1 Tax=Bacillus sp. AR18-7 TaxID=2217821 RepID=UPI0011C7E34C|nr:hypothetical protein [Bacillus sp. AR18-7]TXR58947.1 hypothetical protein DN395_26005 [Bacillus sp. AR18-7]